MNFMKMDKVNYKSIAGRPIKDIDNYQLGWHAELIFFVMSYEWKTLHSVIKSILWLWNRSSLQEQCQV